MTATKAAPHAHEANGHADRFAPRPVGVVSDVSSVRLNLGGGDVHLTGFRNLDRKTGQEVYPLADVADNSVEEILASHVLEHFSHRDVKTVLEHWVAKLRPGGKIRLAVPDFRAVAAGYLDGQPLNVQGYVMGGHVDADDHHGCIFDRENLLELMVESGLERIGDWKSDLPACSSLPISLNLQGFKPANADRTVTGVRGCMSVPRFGPLMHPRCMQRAFAELGIVNNSGQSCFWHQMLSNQMEDALADRECDFVLTMDFDTIFCADDVRELYRLLRASPEVDAVFPLQSKRGCEASLFSIADADGNLRPSIVEEDLSRNLLPANTGHFGLTLFRAESLRKFPRPWMVPEPNAKGLWRDGHRDADIDFWKRFKAAGFKCFLAPKVVVGHLQEVVTWPGKDLKPIHQSTGDYEETGIPAEVAR